MASSETLMMVSMNDLRDVINAAAEYHNGKQFNMSLMLHSQESDSNPIVKLRNQYLAAIDLCYEQPVGCTQ